MSMAGAYVDALVRMSGSPFYGMGGPPLLGNFESTSLVVEEYTGLVPHHQAMLPALAAAGACERSGRDPLRSICT